jgi:drug/metabolite transporter (DMT)-like permease
MDPGGEAQRPTAFLTLPGAPHAILMTCLASLCFTLNDTITKFLIDGYETSFIILVRSLFAMPLLMLIAVVLGRSRVRWSRRMWLYALRGALGLAAAWMYVRALETLSVAEATVIVFASPFIVTFGSRVFFGETVGWQKWAAVMVSFAGVVIAIQPATATFKPASLLILACAFLYASISLTARFLPKEDTLWTVSFFSAAFAALFVTPLTWGQWTPVQTGDLLLFVGAALCSSLGIGLGSLAYRLAPASELAPYAYSGLIWSTAATWIVWGNIPGAWTLVGAAVVASSTVFHFLSGRRRSPPGATPVQRAARKPGPPFP